MPSMDHAAEHTRVLQSSFKKVTEIYQISDDEIAEILLVDQWPINDCSAAILVRMHHIIDVCNSAGYLLNDWDIARAWLRKPQEALSTSPLQLLIRNPQSLQYLRATLLEEVHEVAGIRGVFGWRD